jgi:hypothetical protein
MNKEFWGELLNPIFFSQFYRCIIIIIIVIHLFYLSEELVTLVQILSIY